MLREVYLALGLYWPHFSLVFLIHLFLYAGVYCKPINPLWKRIHRFIWSTMIRVISDHWSWSGSSQRNAPKETVNFSPLLMQLLHWQFLVALCYHTSLLYFAFFVALVATACSRWHSWYFHHNNHLQTCYKRKPSWKLSFPKNLPHAKTHKTEQV